MKLKRKLQILLHCSQDTVMNKRQKGSLLFKVASLENGDMTYKTSE